jgi:glucose/arabinose dehydrogenase
LFSFCSTEIQGEIIMFYSLLQSLPLFVVVIALFLMLVATVVPKASADDLPISKLKLPPGFKISTYATNVRGARSMVLSPKGTLFVGTREEGALYAIPDENNDKKGDSVITIGRGMFHPNGVEFKDGSLYVAEINRVLRYDGIEAKLNKPPQPVVVNSSLPNKTHHGQKYIRFSPDGWLYVPVGAPCNNCESSDERFASILRMKPDGSNLEVYAKGVRNTVGMDFHPTTKELWFTDNGRDYLGDDRPPEELNCAPKKGMHFGFPYCHGGTISDPEFGRKHPCSEFTPPELNMPAHTAALGMRFYTGKMFPPEYNNVALICFHGSWNRSVPDGYRVDAVYFKNGKPIKREPFIYGWLQSSGVWGRPVDVLIMPDGSVLVSDDHSGTIYRVTYEGSAKASTNSRK